MEVDCQRALEIALSKRGLSWQREVEIPIAYDGVIVARRCVDFLVEDSRDQFDLSHLIISGKPYRYTSERL